MPAVQPTKEFEKALVRLKNELRRQAAIDAIEKFVETPHLPSLNFEKLQGLDLYSIRSKRGDRVIMKKDDRSGETYVLLDVGGHDIYRRQSR